MTKHIVSVSSGLGSAYTWKLICDRYGPENVTGLFADVNGEHPDNYRFLADVQYALGSRLVKLTNDGRTIWDVMIEQRFLANTRIDSCSKFLKREPIRAWLKANADPADATLYLGIDWSEIHRLDRAQARWGASFGGIAVASPMCEPPYRHKSQARDWLASEGIAMPALYAMGFEHANCGGGCVKAGIGQFKRLLAVDRRWYMNWWEAGEERVRAALGREDISILRDRRGGQFRPLTLRQLREGIDSEPSLFGDEDGGPGCGFCFLGEEDAALCLASTSTGLFPSGPRRGIVHGCSPTPPRPVGRSTPSWPRRSGSTGKPAHCPHGTSTIRPPSIET